MLDGHQGLIYGLIWENILLDEKVMDIPHFLDRKIACYAMQILVSSFSDDILHPPLNFHSVCEFCD